MTIFLVALAHSFDVVGHAPLVAMVGWKLTSCSEDSTRLSATTWTKTHENNTSDHITTNTFTNGGSGSNNGPPPLNYQDDGFFLYHL